MPCLAVLRREADPIPSVILDVIDPRDEGLEARGCHEPQAAEVHEDPLEIQALCLGVDLRQELADLLAHRRLGLAVERDAELAVDELRGGPAALLVDVCADEPAHREQATEARWPSRCAHL